MKLLKLILIRLGHRLLDAETTKAISDSFTHCRNTKSGNIMVDKCILHTLFLFIRILFFPAKGEYSYFYADFKMKIGLQYS